MKGLIVAFDPLENVEIDLSSGYKADKILGDNSGSFFLIFKVSTPAKTFFYRP